MAILVDNNAPVIPGDDVLKRIDVPAGLQGLQSYEGSILFTDTDIADAHNVEVIAQTGDQTGVTFTPVIGEEPFDGEPGQISWVLDVDPSVLSGLTVGEELTLSYTLALTDQAGARVEQVVTITLAGSSTAVLDFSLADAVFRFGESGVEIDGPEGQQLVLSSAYDRFEFTDGTVNEADGNAAISDLFYYANSKDVWTAGIDADIHYSLYGWQEGRDPNAYFSTSGYIAANKDVDAANINPLSHYQEFGWKEGRDASVSFDTTLYLLNNPDVKDAGVDPLEHFLAWGRAEGRQAYTAVGLEVQGTFDAEYYLLANPDVGVAGIDAAFHFANWGWKEDRDPNAFFDTSAYLAANEDVAEAGINPLEHYTAYGWQEGRNPSAAFNTDAYLNAYEDVAQSGVNPLAHYLKYGIYEGRSAFADSVIG
jgi:hypothetical protein